MKISNAKLAIGVPLSFPFVPASFFHSFIMMDRPSFVYLHADNGPIHELRNNLVAKAKEVGATSLLMMDTDQVYHPETVTRLLSHRLPIVGALVHRRYVPFDSLLLKLVEIDEHTNGYESIDEWEDGSLVNVDATGGGCLMFDMQLFYDLDKLWQKEIDAFNATQPTPGELSLLSESSRQYILTLQERFVPIRQPGKYFRNDKIIKPGLPPVGEDIGLCQDIKAAGYDIFVDTSVPAGHLTNLVVNTATNRLWRAIDNKKAIYQALKIDDNREIANG
jgi:hypothetical protein